MQALAPGGPVAGLGQTMAFSLSLARSLRGHDEESRIVVDNCCLCRRKLVRRKESVLCSMNWLRCATKATTLPLR